MLYCVDSAASLAMIYFLRTLLKKWRELPMKGIGGGLFGIITRIARWQLAARLWRGDIVFDFVAGTSLIGRKGLTLASGQFYFGFSQWQVSPFLLHALQPGDRFADVGANIGVDTVLAAAVVRANVIACEPSSVASRYLQRNVFINGIADLVSLRMVAVGDHAGTIALERGRDALNRVAATAPLSADQFDTVPVETLDDLTDSGEIDILKIDILGYEPLAFRGGMRTLSNPRLKAVILGVPRRAEDFGLDPQESIHTLCGLGFHPVTYDVLNRRLAPLQVVDVNEFVIFVRDRDEMQERISNAKSFERFQTRF